MMDGSTACHLLQLPAELRVAIWSYVFHRKDHEQPLNLTNWARLLPTQSLLSVNRQIRAESLPLYKDNIAQLGQAHWCYTIDARIIDQAHRKRLRAECQRLPYSVLKIHRLEVRIEFPCTAYGPRTPIAWDFYADKPLPQLVTTTSIIARYRTTFLERLIQRAVIDRSIYAFSFVDGDCLSVTECLRPFFAAFEYIPFFSSMEFWEY